MLSTIPKIFINPEQQRLRAGWRLLFQTALIFIFALGLAILAFPMSFIFPQLVVSTFAVHSAALVAITAAVFLARKWIDRRSIVSLGLQLDRKAGLDLLVGVGITFLMMSVIFAIQWAAGWLQIEAFAWQIDPLPVVIGRTALTGLTFVFVGWYEELLSRGYHLQNLASGLNLFWGVVISSSIFGIMHLGNPNANWSSAAGVCLAGFFMAAGYLRTRQLWLPIGIHIGWNFFEGAIFGFPVSGLNTYRLLRISVDGPELWTGGAFGPEAGLILIPGMLIGFGLLLIYTRQRLQPVAKGSGGWQEEDNPEKPMDII